MLCSDIQIKSDRKTEITTLCITFVFVVYANFEFHKVGIFENFRKFINT